MVLAGRDDRTGIDDSFRREWIRRRMEALASVFGIDVLTYAITSNHAQLAQNGMVKQVSFCGRLVRNVGRFD